MEEVKVLKAIADETRLAIVKFLMNGEKCVYEIVAITGKSQLMVSLHLRVLREAGIVKFRKGVLREPGMFKFKKEVNDKDKFCYYYSINDDIVNFSTFDTQIHYT